MLTLRSLLGGLAAPHSAAAAAAVIGAQRAFAAGGGPSHMQLIKELRESTGAPISDVKAALQAADWDLDAASKELRKRGLAAAAKKAARHAAQGLVGVAAAADGGAAAAVEVNSETDFVARNEQFGRLVGGAAAAALTLEGQASGSGHELDAAALLAAPCGVGGGSVAAEVAAVGAAVRENVRLRRAARLVARPGGVVGAYVHGGAGGPPGLGRIAALVALEPAAGGAAPAASAAAALRDAARQLAMHVVGASPRFLDAASVPAAALDAERAALHAAAAASGKPAAIVAKMVDGRLRAWAEANCLLQQRFVADDEQSVAQVVAAAGERAGVALAVTGFVRLEVGEGLAAAQGKGFADEVAELAARGG